MPWVEFVRNWTETDWAEWRREREAIMELDGGLSAEEAKRRAGVFMQLERTRITSEKAEEIVRAERKAAGPGHQQVLLPGMEQAWGGG